MAPVCYMPEFASATHAFHHTVDSALSTLSALNISPPRITLRMDGLGYPTHWIVNQSPAAGAPLSPDMSISLTVAGTGIFHALPVGMWDKGSDAEIGTQEIVELLDDPFQKLAHWFREGARLFDVRADNPAACSRWISLFGLNPEDWPAEMWYKLSLLLPNVQALAGKEYGLRFALQLLFDLPLLGIWKSPRYRYLADADLSLLGASFNTLGFDLIVGDHVDDLSTLELVLGHVSLGTYHAFQQDEHRRLLGSALALLMPVYQAHTVSWVLLDPAKQPRLGYDEHNALLGLNSYLGPPAHCSSRSSRSSIC